MVVAVLNILVALVLGFGAVQEFIVRIRDREVQPSLIPLAGIVVSVLFITSGVAILRRWPSARRLAIITALLSILFHVYAALPPHPNVGPPVLIIGVGYGVVLLVYALKGRQAEPAIG
jgi:hypothetical protein